METPLQSCLSELSARHENLRATLVQAASPLGPVSVVLATYNRCPFSPDGPHAGDNPLVWALDSLLAQVGNVVSDLVVVDDGSDDYTGAVLNQYAMDHKTDVRAQAGALGRGDVAVRVMRLSGHQGSSAARNAGAAAVRSRWVLYADDDCVMPPLWAAGALHVMADVQRSDPAAAALMLPFYYRDLQPTDMMSTQALGQLDLVQARFGTGFHRWPDTYLPHPPMDALGLVKALRVDLVGGLLLLDRQALDRAGGWADQSAWATSYTDQVTLSADLARVGSTLYFTPDPRLGSPHFKWGAAGRYPAAPRERLEQCVGQTGRSLKDLVALAGVPRTQTGCRTTPEVFLEEEIGSFFEFFAARNLLGAQAWALRTYQEFVLDAVVHTHAVTAPDDLEHRRRVWRQGIERGARAASQHAPLKSDAAWEVVDRVTQILQEPAIVRG